MLEIEQQQYVTIPLNMIINKLSVRRKSEAGLKRIIKSMQKLGFLDNYPLIVIALPDGTYLLIDGNHRLEAAKALGIIMVPCVIKTDLTELEQYKLALESNNAAETIVPSTMVTYADFIWDRLTEKDEKGKKKYTQEQVGKMLGGWSEDRVSQYYLLRKQICEAAWDIIASSFDNPTTFRDDGSSPDETEVGTNPTPVGFTEKLLRSILPLEPEQQLELVQGLINGEIFSKNSFKSRADNYRARKEAKTYGLKKMGDLGEPYITQLKEEIDKGIYDDDWKKTADHPKLHKLIAFLQEEWERKNSIHLIHGDFYEEVQKIGDGTIDLILTDPPYNIANERDFDLEGRKNISQDFGVWDKYEDQAFIDSFTIWAREWFRLLREGGSGYVFTADLYLHPLREALKQAGLTVHIPLIWYKQNPPPQIMENTFQSTAEYILFFVKGKDFTFHWQGHAGEMHNVIPAPICGGDERVHETKNKQILHPTQKPLKILKRLMEISSNKGDMVFDGFAGVGSSGKAAKDLGRKFIGIEQDEVFFKAMQRRLGDD